MTACYVICNYGLFTRLLGWLVRSVDRGTARCCRQRIVDGMDPRSLSTILPGRSSHYFLSHNPQAGPASERRGFFAPRFTPGCAPKAKRTIHKTCSSSCLIYASSSVSWSSRSAHRPLLPMPNAHTTSESDVWRGHETFPGPLLNGAVLGGKLQEARLLLSSYSIRGQRKTLSLPPQKKAPQKSGTGAPHAHDYEAGRCQRILHG